MERRDEFPFYGGSRIPKELRMPEPAAYEYESLINRGNVNGHHSNLFGIGLGDGRQAVHDVNFRNQEMELLQRFYSAEPRNGSLADKHIFSSSSPELASMYRTQEFPHEKPDLHNYLGIHSNPHAGFVDKHVASKRVREEGQFHPLSRLQAPVSPSLAHQFAEFDTHGSYNDLPRAAADSSLSAAKVAMAYEDSMWRGREEVGHMYGGSPRLNSRGLPLRPGEPDCAFFMKSGSCKYGAVCKFTHPEPSAGSIGNGGHFPMGVVRDSGLDHWQAGGRQYPERPGQAECAFYMKTGTCKYGAGCKFHHPLNRQVAASAAAGAGKPTGAAVKLTLAGLPRRAGEVACPYYMKTGACKYGPSCKFDHPPPGEAAAAAAAMATKKESPLGEEEPMQTNGVEGLTNDDTSNMADCTPATQPT